MIDMKEEKDENIKLKLYDEMLELQTIARHTPKNLVPKISLNDFLHQVTNKKLSNQNQPDFSELDNELLDKKPKRKMTKTFSTLDPNRLRSTSLAENTLKIDARK